MAKTYNFARQRGLGKWGEGQIIEYLKTMDMVKEVIDVADDKEYQKKGIDLLITFQNPFTHEELKNAVDVKMDMLHHRTGNLFIETESSDVSKKKGCALSSEADSFLFYDPFGKQMFIVQLEKVRKYYEEQKDGELKDKMKRVKNKDYVTKGFAVAAELLIELGIAVRYSLVKEEAPVV